MPEMPAMKARRIDHICIAVRNLEKARTIYEQTFGLQLADEYVAESEKIHVARYYLGDVALELMESTDPDGEVAKFIQKQGEGVFLISYKVDDVQQALDNLQSQGKRLIDTKPRQLFGQKYAFIMHPSDTCGVLTEIIEGDYQPDPKS